MNSSIKQSVANLSSAANTHVQLSFGLPLAVVAALASACATKPLGTQSSVAGIRAAQEVGAADVPQASLHLQLAREELATAQKLQKSGEHAQATSMLQRAQADAELAVALSREDAEKKKAIEAVESVRLLREENKLPATTQPTAKKSSQ